MWDCQGKKISNKKSKILTYEFRLTEQILIDLRLKIYKSECFKTHTTYSYFF